MVSDRTHKLQALQAAISGNTDLLKAYKATQKQPYSEAEREAQQQYLTGLCGYEVSLKEVVAFFGRGIPMGGNTQGYELPNGMLLYF